MFRKLTLTSVILRLTNAWMCPNGSSPEPYSLQLGFAADISAFKENDVYQTYRSELLKFSEEMVMYGSKTVLTMYMFSNKGGQQNEAYCASAFDVRWETVTSVTQTMTDTWNRHPTCPDRPLTGIASTKKYSSLQDVMFHFHRRVYGPGEFDSAGNKKIIFLQVATDTLPWYNDDNTIFKDIPLPTFEQTQGYGWDPGYYCNKTNYPSVDQIVEGAEAFKNVTFYHFLTQKGDEASENLVTYYKDHYMPVVLGGAVGWSDPLPSGGHHKELTHKRIQEAICGPNTMSKSKCRH